MDAPHRCLHCALHDAIQAWVNTYGHPGAIEILRCLSVVEWDVKQAAEWWEDGPVPTEIMDTHH